MRQIKGLLTKVEMGALIGIACVWLIGATVGYMLYYDFKAPIYNVTGYSDTRVSPGMPVKLYFVYSRDYTPSLEVISRRLVCEDGTVWEPETLDVPYNSREAWTNGTNVTASITIRIPFSVEAPNVCFYSSMVLYHRNLLPDLFIQMPPVPISINVVPDPQDGFDALRS